MQVKEFIRTVEVHHPGATREAPSITGINVESDKVVCTQGIELAPASDQPEANETNPITLPESVDGIGVCPNACKPGEHKNCKIHRKILQEVEKINADTKHSIYRKLDRDPDLFFKPEGQEMAYVYARGFKANSIVGPAIAAQMEQSKS